MTIKYLVISGGGPNILQLYGAYKYLNKKNIWSLENIKSIYATSAGTIISLLLILNISFDDIDNYLINRPWDSIFFITPQNIFKLFNATGLFDKSAIYELLNPLVKSKNYNIDMSLKDLYEITNIDFYLYTTCLNNFKSIELSHKSNPEMKVIDAIYSSISIPFLFEPLLYKEKYYFDGGLFSNYPLDICLNHNKDNEEFNTDEILGVCSKTEGMTNLNDVEESISLTNVFDYFFQIIRKMINYCNNSLLANSIKHEVRLDFSSFSISVWNELVTSKELRKTLILEPEEKINILLKKWN